PIASGGTMRVILNGTSALKPKTGVGHTTVNLHRALTALQTPDSFWLYPGTAIAGVASRWLGRSRRTKASGTTVGRSEFPWRNRLTSVAKAAYRVHFRTAARWGGFDL